MFRFTPLNFHKLNSLTSPSLRGASATRQSRLLNHILDCFAPLAMTILGVLLLCFPLPAFAATSIPFTINLSKAVNVTGAPRIAVDVGGVTRYATYASGTGTSALTFNYAMVAGDVDLDGVTVSSPIDLNGGTIKDLVGNDLSPLTFTPPNTTNVKVNYPSLGMDFVYDADGRYTLNGTAYNDLTSFLSATGGTFTRASIGTYFDSAGILQTAASGVPRFDYDPVTHAAKGILIEESKVNYVGNSEGVGGSGWGSNNIAFTSNTTTSPSGLNTADLLTRTSTTSSNYAQYTYSTGTGTYTLSAFIKAASTGNYFGLRIQGNYPDRGDALFNAAAGTIIGTTASGNYSGASSTIIPLGGGWYRVSLTVTAAVSNVTALIMGPTDASKSTIGWEASSTILSDIYVWGIQFEQGSFATSYIPTTTAAVTRAADVLSVPSSIGSSGSWFSQFQTSPTSAQVSIFGTNPGGQSVPKLTKVGTTLQITRPQIGVIASKSISPASSDSLIKAALSYSNTSSSITGNALSIVAGSSGGSGVATSVTVGVAETANNEFINGTVGKLKYYPSRISDTQLQLLTQ